MGNKNEQDRINDIRVLVDNLYAEVSADKVKLLDDLWNEIFLVMGEEADELRKLKLRLNRLEYENKELKLDCEDFEKCLSSENIKRIYAEREIDKLKLRLEEAEAQAECDRRNKEG